jgi:hypothetical protein
MNQEQSPNNFFIIPDRFETIKARPKAEEELKKIVVEIEKDLEYIDDIFNNINVAQRGSFSVFRGASGIGKTTFLQTVHLFRENIETISIFNNVSISDFLSEQKVDNFKQNYQIIIIEGRETLAHFPGEIEKDIHSINTFLRSSLGKSSLIVWLCNNSEIQDRLVEIASQIGGKALLGFNEPVYYFKGPLKQYYLNIAEQTISTLNPGFSLTNLGITRKLAEDFVEDPQVNTIGDYLSLIREQAVKNEKTLITLVKKDPFKLWIVVINRTDRPDYISTLTTGNCSYADIDRLTEASEANVVKECKKQSDKIGVLARFLDVRIIYFPISTTLSIVRLYADEGLKKLMTENNMKLVTREKDTKQKLMQSQLYKALKVEPMGVAKPSTKPTDATQDAFEKLLKISQNHDSKLNKCIGKSLLDGNVISWFKAESKLGNELIVISDLLCQSKSSERIRIEFMWRKSAGIPDIANYTMKKIYYYGKAIGFLD